MGCEVEVCILGLERKSKNFHKKGVKYLEIKKTQRDYNKWYI